jgi:hypothetical protein
MNKKKIAKAIPPENRMAMMPLSSLGATGVRLSGGYILDDWERELTGLSGRRKYREMSDSDATIGAALNSVKSEIKSVPWDVEPNPNDLTNNGAAFMESCIEDMECTWDDFIARVLTSLEYGFSPIEKIFKVRGGDQTSNPALFSKYNDGLIGIRDLAPRAQETILEWCYDDDGCLCGLYQQNQFAKGKPARIFIPRNKFMLFRTTAERDNPEGRSILRNCYRSYKIMQRIQNIEAVGVERNMTGTGIAYVPQEVLDDPVVAESYRTLVRDLKQNEQSGVVLPSETYQNLDGSRSTVRKVSLELLPSPGQSPINTSEVIRRWQQDIAMTMLTDFVLLGHGNSGSFALGQGKIDFFKTSLEFFLKQICSVINRDLIPHLWRLNGFDKDTMPTMKYGKIGSIDPTTLSDNILKLSTAGFTLAADPKVDEYVREQVGLPANSTPLWQQATPQGSGQSANSSTNSKDESGVLS